MKEYSCFDILGPIMVGPSSSHTAGACRLGRIARAIAGEEIVEAVFMLHGSFKSTYRGHGTDLALLAGVLGMAPDDERLANSFEEARKAGVAYVFEAADLGNVHPNSVRFRLKHASGRVTEVTGCSTGGGSVLITEIDGMPVEFSGDYHTLITQHLDRPGIVARVTNELALHNVNIAFMKVFREEKGSRACMVIESDQPIPIEIEARLRTINGLERSVVIPALGGAGAP